MKDLRNEKKNQFIIFKVYAIDLRGLELVDFAQHIHASFSLQVKTSSTVHGVSQLKALRNLQFQGYIVALGNSIAF